MKRVILVRHAKSEPYGYDDDFNRDLVDRGIQDAEKISSRLKQDGIIADLVIASPAERAMHTASIYCRNLFYPLALIRQESILYSGLTTLDFVELLHQISDDVQTVLVFGHNPTVHQLAYNLVTNFCAEMPTCSTVAVDFELEKWSEVSAREGKVAFHYVPKNIF